MKYLPLTLLGVTIATGAFGQNIMPNASFESGSSSPTSWTPSGSGQWVPFGHSGSRSVSSLGGAGQNRSWINYSCPVQSGRAYVVRYWTRGTNVVGGYTIGGFDTVSRDFSRPGNPWVDFSYVASIPSIGVGSFRLGCFDAIGTYFFDDVEVLPLSPVYKNVGPYSLGDGESLSVGRYTHELTFGGYGGNFSRCLVQANTSFNTFKWYMNPGSAIVYRHALGGQSFSNAQVTCTIQNYNNISSKTVVVEASTNAGATWLPVGAMTGTNAVPLDFPPGILPAPEVYVRLKSTNALQFGLVSYKFAADVPDTITAGTGETFHFGQWLAATNIQVAQVNSSPTGKVVTLAIFNSNTIAQQFEVSAKTEYVGNFRERTLSTVVSPGATNWLEVLLPTAGFGENTALLTVRDAAGTNLFQQSLRLNVSILTDDSYGEALPSPTNCSLWWCEGTHKVGLDRFPPIATNTAAFVAAARNEYEPFQIVLRPETALSNITVSVGDFVSTTNPAVTISSTNVAVCRVEYVPVTILDYREVYSTVGAHPDVLIPLTAPFDAPAQTNCPLWFTVHVPKDAPAGEYLAEVTIQSSGASITALVRLRVYNFALTDVTHSRTAYGAIPKENWHGLNSAPISQHAQVWELYMQNMARHRASPFFPQWYSQIQWTYNTGSQSFSFNFTNFDAAMATYIEEYNFTSFKDINYNRELPPLLGVPTFTPTTNGINPSYRTLYTKLMQPVVQHLRERGWLDKAYSFWIDEPTVAQLPLVRNGMQMVGEMAPDLPRVQAGLNAPYPELFGEVEIWWPNWDTGMQFHTVEPRQAAGDEVWYYVATVPKAPWPNNFIDHPGLNPRIRQWYAESMGLQGEAYYGINYYLGGGAGNPWFDVMSLIPPKPGFPLYYLGNGDGTLVYPPVKAYPTNPVISGPLDSTRWEVIRDGVEDREYFWTLSRVLTNGEIRLGTNHPAVIEGRAARTAALVGLPWYPAYPFETPKLLTARERIAFAIEALDDGAPFIAKEPLSKVVSVGGMETLRMEAGGWPVPSIQWQHAGTNLPGATAARLVLSNINLGMAGEYRAVVSNSVGTAVSRVGKLTVLDASLPPQIIAQPVSLTCTNLGRAVFGVGASSLTPLTYQWRHDGLALAGQTNVTLVLTNLAGTNAGFYSVMVSNTIGLATSLDAYLSVVPPEGAVGPSITSHPTNQSLFAGQTAVLTVAASGTGPLSYQWQFNGTNLLAGGTANTLTLTNIQLAQAGSYQVTVGNTVGVVTSAVATVTVQSLAPFITSGPTNVSVIQGQVAQFVVVADGTSPLSYQWFFNGTNLLVGANGSSLTLTNVQPAQTGNYVVLITNIVGAVTSAPAMLALQGLPNYTNEPPGMLGYLQGVDLILSLAPDNRSRTVLVSTNLLDWQSFYTASPSATFVLVPAATTNAPHRYFRLVAEP